MMQNDFSLLGWFCSPAIIQQCSMFARAIYWHNKFVSEQLQPFPCGKKMRRRLQSFPHVEKKGKATEVLGKGEILKNMQFEFAFKNLQNEVVLPQTLHLCTEAKESKTESLLKGCGAEQILAIMQILCFSWRNLTHLYLREPLLPAGDGCHLWAKKCSVLAVKSLSYLLGYELIANMTM